MLSTAWLCLPSGWRGPPCREAGAYCPAGSVLVRALWAFPVCDRKKVWVLSGTAPLHPSPCRLPPYDGFRPEQRGVSSLWVSLIRAKRSGVVL